MEVISNILNINTQDAAPVAGYVKFWVAVLVLLVIAGMIAPVVWVIVKLKHFFDVHKTF